MIKTTEFSTFMGDAKSLSPTAMAFVGDAVYELLVRGHLLNKHTIPAKKLHTSSVEQVNANAQAKGYDTIMEMLTDEEREILRRGRNANTTRAPKNTTSENYHKATALECLFGFLFLSSRLDRVVELFEFIKNSDIKSENSDEEQIK